MSKTLQKITYTHDAMVDVILQDPTVTSSELAELFGYSQAWVSRILASDSFQARIAQRKAKLLDPIVARNLTERMRSVGIRSLEIVEEKLSKEPSAAYAMQALELATLGMSSAVAQSAA